VIFPNIKIAKCGRKLPREVAISSPRRAGKAGGKRLLKKYWQAVGN